MTLAATAKVAAAAGVLALAGSGTVTVTLTAPGHTPKINVHWPYSVSVTRAGRPAAATVTAQIVDPIGGVHPVQFGKSTKYIVNWPFRGTFNDFLIWPPNSAVGLPLTFRLTVRAGGETKVITYRVTPQK
jgi:hypothetical protein